MREAQITIKLFILGQVDSCVQPIERLVKQTLLEQFRPISAMLSRAPVKAVVQTKYLFICEPLRARAEFNLKDTSTERRFYSGDLKDVRF